jgi:hypothetical protein
MPNRRTETNNNLAGGFYNIAYTASGGMSSRDDVTSSRDEPVFIKGIAKSGAVCGLIWARG